MGTPRFTPEFKEKAFSQITEHGYSVAEISDRLGVFAHSLYNLATPNDTKKALQTSATWKVIIHGTAFY